MKKNKKLIIAIGVLIALFTLLWLLNFWKNTNQKAQAEQAYEEEINNWHVERVNELKKEHGWLSLVALDWLKEGKNTFASVGVITLNNGTPSVQIDQNVQATVGGKKFISGILKTDAEKSGPDTIFIGTRAHIIIKRGERYAFRVLDSASPARTRFTHIERYPITPRWRIEAQWSPYEKPKALSIETVTLGYKEEGFTTGEAVFSIEGKEYRIEPIVNETQTDYFFIIGDKTNGAETYGGGRFLHIGPPKDGKIIVDFNKTTNPPCAFTEFATCPLPPPSNVLPFRIDAGEKKYSNH